MRCKQKSKWGGKTITSIREQNEMCVKVLIRRQQAAATRLRREMGFSYSLC